MQIKKLLHPYRTKEFAVPPELTAEYAVQLTDITSMMLSLNAGNGRVYWEICSVCHSGVIFCIFPVIGFAPIPNSLQAG